MSNHFTTNIQDQDFYTLSEAEILKLFGASEAGLTADSVAERLVSFGPNQLPNQQKLGTLRLFFSQFANTMVGLMCLAAGLSFLFEHFLDAALIFSMVIINAIMGFVQEFRAEQSIAALKKLLVNKVTVRRQARVLEIQQTELVPGDIILLEAGAQVPADARILKVHNCLVSESALTGESMPVEKTVKQLDTAVPMAERVNMLWMGTTIMQGNVEAVVVATGIKTQFGLIAANLGSIETEKEHFFQKMSVLSKQMGFIAVASAVLTFIIGFGLQGYSLPDISIYTIATLVSALPEGLPIILVIVLAVGAQRMAKKKAIVRKLSATETLGVVSVIITDKTGTLTKNSMSAHSIFFPGQAVITVGNNQQSSESTFHQQGEPLLLHEAKQLQELASMTAVSHQVKVSEPDNISFTTLLGDPTEKALFLLAHQIGFQDLSSDRTPTVIDDIPFQQALCLRGTLVQRGQQKQIYVLGAPESVLQRVKTVQVENKVVELSPSWSKKITEQVESFSAQGLRVIGLGIQDVPDSLTELTTEKLDHSQLTFVGLVALHDPPKPEVAQALIEAKAAGIKVVMATGDHPQTALAIAKEIGLVEKNAEAKALTEADLAGKSPDEWLTMIQTNPVLARLSPATKLKVAQMFQDHGHVVAMTGDGVNDAPALKKADVGIAMGITGTDVAREASKIVLADDNFASIIAAIKEGRTQFSNLRRTSVFLIMTNVAESVALLVTLGLGFPLPLLPLQILWLNVITGGLTDFALSLEPAHDEAMKFPPRSPKENILIPAVLPLVGIVTVVTTALSVGMFIYFLEDGVEKARTAVFTILALSQVLNMFNLRSLRRSVFEIGWASNKAVIAAMVIALLLLAVALWLPLARNLLSFSHLEWYEFGLLVLASMSIFLVAEAVKKYSSQSWLSEKIKL
jgi:Ca2+-transporting ATPase